MTTIAFDGRYLAADTLGVRGGNRSEQPSCKIAVGDGYRFAFGGMWGHFRYELMAWVVCGLRDDAPRLRGCPAADVDGAMLVVTPMGGLLVFTDKAPYPDPEAWPFAAGTGSDIALGAMGAGASAMEAVRIAARWDLNTGSEVDFLYVGEIDKGVQRWDGGRDYELKRGLLPAAHGAVKPGDYVKFDAIGRAEMCEHGYIRTTCATCG